EVRVDGTLSLTKGSVRTLELDPGHHALTVSARGYISDSFPVSLLPGEGHRQTLVLRPIAQRESSETSKPKSKPLTSRPLFWVACGGAVLVAVAVGLGLGLSRGGDKPYPGTTGVVLEGLGGAQHP